MGTNGAEEGILFLNNGSDVNLVLTSVGAELPELTGYNPINGMPELVLAAERAEDGTKASSVQMVQLASTTTNVVTGSETGADGASESGNTVADNRSGGRNVATGDASSMAGWGTTAMASLAALAGALADRKRRRGQKR